jgi:hypothetical protein
MAQVNPDSQANHWVSKAFTALAATGQTDHIVTQMGQSYAGVHTAQVVTTGSPTGAEIALEGSLDGTNWFDLSGSQTVTSTTMFHVVNRLVKFIRFNLTTLTGGSSPTVQPTYLGTQKV